MSEYWVSPGSQSTLCENASQVAEIAGIVLICRWSAAFRPLKMNLQGHVEAGRTLAWQIPCVQNYSHFNFLPDF